MSRERMDAILGSMFGGSVTRAEALEIQMKAKRLRELAEEFSAFDDSCTLYADIIDEEGELNPDGDKLVIGNRDVEEEFSIID